MLFLILIQNLSCIIQLLQYLSSLTSTVQNKKLTIELNELAQRLYCRLCCVGCSVDQCDAYLTDCCVTGTPPESEDDGMSSGRRRSSVSSTDLPDGLEIGEVVDTEPDRGRSSSGYRRSGEEAWTKRHVCL